MYSKKVKAAGIAIGVAGLLGLSACGSDESPNAAATSAAPSVVVSVSPSATGDTGAKAAVMLTPADVKFKDGLRLRFVKAETFTPAAGARGYEAGDVAIALTFETVNGSKSRHGIKTAVVTITDAAGNEAEEIFDDTKMSGGFTKAPFDPGMTDTGTFAFSIPKGGFATFTLKFDLSIVLDPAEFKGTIS